MNFNTNEIKEGYLIHKSENNYVLCKIIKKYKTEDEAIKALIEKLTSKK